MRRMIALAIVAALLGIPGPAPASYHEPVPDPGTPEADVELTISNFRYCDRPICLPTDQGYQRTQDGPEEGTDNELFTVEVRPGDEVRWTYADRTGCDLFQGNCTGHNIVFEGEEDPGPDPNDTDPDRFASWGSSDTITFEIPEDAASGDTLRYYCSIQDHWALGMTGILEVVADGE